MKSIVSVLRCGIQIVRRRSAFIRNSSHEPRDTPPGPALLMRYLNRLYSDIFGRLTILPRFFKNLKKQHHRSIPYLAKWLVLKRPRLAGFQRPLTSVAVNDCGKQAPIGQVAIVVSYHRRGGCLQCTGKGLILLIENIRQRLDFPALQNVIAAQAKPHINLVPLAGFDESQEPDRGGRNKSIAQNISDVPVTAASLVTCGHCGAVITGESVMKKKTGKEYVYYRCSKYTAPGHPRIRLTEQALDVQVLALFDRIRLPDDLRHWFQQSLLAWSKQQRSETEDTAKDLQRQITQAKQFRDRLLNLRIMEEITTDTYGQGYRIA